MFKKRFKIVQISACTNNNYFYTVGLGNDNKCYLWDKIQEKWVFHNEKPPKAPVPPVTPFPLPTPPTEAPKND